MLSHPVLDGSGARGGIVNGETQSGANEMDQDRD